MATLNCLALALTDSDMLWLALTSSSNWMERVHWLGVLKFEILCDFIVWQWIQCRAASPCNMHCVPLASEFIHLFGLMSLWSVQTEAVEAHSISLQSVLLLLGRICSALDVQTYKRNAFIMFIFGEELAFCWSHLAILQIRGVALWFCKGTNITHVSFVCV